MKKVIFWDRDGTLTHHCKTSKYTVHGPQIKLKDDIKYLKELENEFDFYILTNAGGIGRGFFTQEEFWKGEEYFELLMKLEADKTIKECLPAFWHPKNPDNLPEFKKYRKPSPARILEILEKNPEIDSSQSWVVGDSNVDIEVAKNAGLKSFFIQDENNDEKYQNLTNLSPTGIGKNLKEAVKFIKNYKNL